MADADLVLETHYETPFMEHSALERETVLGYVDDEGRVTVVAGHQEPHWARGWTARMLGLPLEQVRVITPPMGGAFGGKQDPWPLMAGALAAYHAPAAGAPDLHPPRIVRRLAQAASLPDGLSGRGQGRRHADRPPPAHRGQHRRLRLRTATTSRNYALVAGGGPYRWQAVDARAWSVYTNGPKAGQMRGFGTPQSTFALECTLDELAVRLGMDPLELRLQKRHRRRDRHLPGLSRRPRRWAIASAWRRSGPPTEAALARAEESEPRAAASDPWRRGVGLAGMWYRFGKSGPITCEAHAELGLDGAITLFFSAPDYGQGTTTVMAQLAAEALGLPRDSLRLVNADTALTPDSGIQGASRSTYWVGGAVAQAAAGAQDRRSWSSAAEMLDRHPTALTLTAEARWSGPAARRCRWPTSPPRWSASASRAGCGASLRPQLGPDFREETRPEYLPFFVSRRASGRGRRERGDGAGSGGAHRGRPRRGPGHQSPERAGPGRGRGPDEPGGGADGGVPPRRQHRL